MADLAIRGDMPAVRRTDWGAVWAGVFCTYAIWAVFGALGFAIFASAGTTNAVGETIWAAVLSCIAFYIGGLEAGRLSATVRGRHDGLIHGLALFGLAVTGAILLVAFGGAVVSGGQTNPTQAATPQGLTFLANLGWGGFVSLFLGWIFAMWGGSTGAGRRANVALMEDRGRLEDRERIRPAA
jgi:hypothetical protein